MSIALCLWGLFACQSGPVVTQSTGMAYEVVVVMEKSLWEGELGTAVHSDLTGK